MPRRKLPVNVLDARGSFLKNKARLQERELEPEVQEPVGEPPGHLAEEACAAWREITGIAYWLTAADRFMLEVACVLMAEFRQEGAFQSARMSNLLRALSSLGLTPTDRSRIQVPKKDTPGSSLDDIL